MNILVSISQNHVLPLRVMLGSLFRNNPGERFDVYLIGEDILARDVAAIASLCDMSGHSLREIHADPALLREAPSLRYYPRTMYYRLLAAELLPDDMERALYLDPDILVINSIRPLYDLDLGDRLFAAAVHNSLINISKHANMMRLSSYTAKGCFNSGVLLMNLPHMRSRVCVDDIVRYAKAYQDFLILPDRDILNGLYGGGIVTVDDSIWNYDARKYMEYLLASQGTKNMEWIKDNVACLHFCGRNKPWREDYTGSFGPLYRHYAHIVERTPQDDVVNQTGVV